MTSPRRATACLIWVAQRGHVASSGVGSFWATRGAVCDRPGPTAQLSIRTTNGPVRSLQCSSVFIIDTYCRVVNLRVFRLSSHSSARHAAQGLQAAGVTTSAGVRHHEAYISVRSDRDDLAALVRALVPHAVPVNLEHLPAPLPGEVPFLS